MKREEKESLLRAYYGAAYYRSYHEIKMSLVNQTGGKSKIRKEKERMEFAKGLKEQARACITSIYKDTNRTGTLDSKDMSEAIVAIQKIAHEDAQAVRPKRRKKSELTHFIRSLDIDDDEEEGVPFK